jgi:hypothetical protein
VQLIDSQLFTALETDYQIGGTAAVIAEWNFNRVVKTTVTNTIDDADYREWPYSKSHFPVSSITDGFRPDAGMVFAFTGKAVPISNSQLAPGGQRFYLASKTTPYKYWISPTTSLSVINQEQVFTGEMSFAISNSDLTVEYETPVKSNKIKVVFTGDVRPVVWRVSIFDQDLNNWVLISTSPTIDVITGRAELWWNGSAWTQTQQLNDTAFKNIKKVKVEFDTVDTPNDRLHVIEIAAMREINLSSRLQNYNISSTMDAVDYIHPVGKMNSNDGTLSIDNRDLAIEIADSTLDYYGLTDGWCEYRTYVIYDMSKYSMDDIYVRTGTMFSNGWAQENPYEYSIELFDIVKILQTIKCPAVLVENKSIARIISMLLDLVGVDRYEFDFEDFDETANIRYFWTDGKESVYEVLNRICESNQCAIYSDEFGKLQLLTRNQIANDTDAADFSLRGQPVIDGPATLLPNFSSLRKRYDLSVNDIEIKYKRRQANIDDLDITGKILTSKVWDTSDTIVLKASPLRLRVDKDAIPEEHVGSDIPCDVFINDKDAETWPFVGSFSIDGEIFKYEGKGYAVIDYLTNTWTEYIIKSNEEKKKYDKQTYNSYQPIGGPTGGASGQPINAPHPSGLYQNKLTGRLHVTARAQDDTKAANHTNNWIDGWLPLRGWRHEGTGIGYIDYGGPSLNLTKVADWRNKPNWSRTQNRWRVENSKAICDHTEEDCFSDKMAFLLRDLGGLEYREFGTRIKFTTGGTAGIVFNITDQDGYSIDDPDLEDVTDAHRYYILSVITSEDVDAAGRVNNEINIDIKNGDDFTPVEPLNTKIADGGGKFQIEKNKWYDVEIVFHDNMMNDRRGNGAIEVFIDGQYIDTYITDDVIRPTNYAGIHCRYSTVAEFEYFYASTTTSRAAPRWGNDEAFGMNIVNLPAGTNVGALINFGSDGAWPGRVAMSVASLDDARLNSAKVYGRNNALVAELGPVQLKPESRKTWLMEDVGRGKLSSMVKLNYTSDAEVSFCFEYTNVGALPYFGYRNTSPQDYSYYSQNKGAYLASRFQNIVVNQGSNFETSGNLVVYGQDADQSLFFDDFGSFVREIRDFDVELSSAPAKGTNIFVSNPHVVVTKSSYNPQRGIFTLANASHQNEIVNGSEQIDTSNSIDHTILMYGYVLIEKEEKTKEVKNDDSIRKHGSRPVDLNAEWINSDEEADALAAWISTHWAEPMATIEVKTFADIFVQIGDKAEVLYSDAQIKPEWLYIVTSLNRTFDDDGLATTMTLRRVR